MLGIFSFPNAQPFMKRSPLAVQFQTASLNQMGGPVAFHKIQP